MGYFKKTGSQLKKVWSLLIETGTNLSLQEG